MKTMVDSHKMSGTNAQRLTMLPDTDFITFYETDTNAEYQWKGSEWVLTSVDGAARVTTMPGGVIHIREHIALTTGAVTFDFSATPIIAAVFFLVPIATVTAEHISAAICIDPPSNAVRDAWLTAATALTTDTQRIPVLMTVPPLELIFTSAIDYIGAMVDVGTTAECKLIIVGVEA